MESALAIANYFIKKGIDEGFEITPMKAIKLVYIAHGWYMAFFGKSLIKEDVQAWKYGPVIKNLYHAVKPFGNTPIREPLAPKKKLFGLIQSNEEGDYQLRDSGIESFLDIVWGQYRQFDGVQLSSMTHQKNTPWDIVWSAIGRFNSDTVIPNEIIRSHYLSLKNDSERKSADRR